MLHLNSDPRARGDFAGHNSGFSPDRPPSSQCKVFWMTARRRLRENTCLNETAPRLLPTPLPSRRAGAPKSQLRAETSILPVLEGIPKYFRGRRTQRHRKGVPQSKRWHGEARQRGSRHMLAKAVPGETQQWRERGVKENKQRTEEVQGSLWGPLDGT